ncbi:MAG TPA: alkaline phosphatase D family protein [Gaiellales bacterium]|nr:alkaline phosphatase D family protein [Gaiellales bacterium]
MTGRRYTRAGLLALAGAAAAGVTARQLLGGGGAAVAPPPGPAPSRFRLRSAFSGPDGWGPRWVPLQGPLMVTAGRAVLTVPAGVHTTAADQPMPVQLLDAVHADGAQRLEFAVTDASLRPGLLLRSTGPHAFVAVTIESGRLVIAEYAFDGRRTVAIQDTDPLAAGARHVLDVRYQGGRVWARAWRGDGPEADWQVSGPVAAVAGNPGVLAVHPLSLRPCRLEVRSHTVATDTQPQPTSPVAPVLISGIPSPRLDGAHDVRMRVWSAYPARIRFEWSVAGGGFEHSPEQVVDGFPLTALHQIRADGGVRWRVRLRSLTGAAETVTPLQDVRLTGHAGGLTLLGASCYKLIGPGRNQGYRRLLEAATRTPAAMVFEGDFGYAGNFNDGSYSRSPAFFADRFQRFLADPGFVAMRQRVPVGFIMDDHEYGPDNNADRTTLLPWTWQLWNQISADSERRGYFDVRAGDVHCLTLDGRRYCDPAGGPNVPGKTKLGIEQRTWMERILRTSDAAMFVVFSGDAFGTRVNPRNGRVEHDNYIYSWPHEYRRVLSAFMDAQLRGKRVLIVSGDCHSLRIDQHPDPQGRPEAAGMRITEFTCAGIRCELWSGAAPGDPNVDRSRYKLNVSGAGLIEIDPPGAADRTITLRAIDATAGRPLDTWQPLVLPFKPA